MEDNGGHRLCSPRFRHDQGNRQITGERESLALAIRFRVWMLYSDPRRSQGSQPSGWMRRGGISQRSLNEGLDLHEERIARDVRGTPGPNQTWSHNQKGEVGFLARKGTGMGTGEGRIYAHVSWGRRTLSPPLCRICCGVDPTVSDTVSLYPVDRGHHAYTIIQA